MRVLVACEFSGTVRDAFRRRGHDAWSCDILPTETPGPHYQCDVREILNEGWQLMIAHPPCTHLAVSGARWFEAKKEMGLQQEALEFFCLLLNAPIRQMAVENPVSVASTRIRKPDQVIEPYQFGHSYTKATCLWLKNLPKLRPTNRVPPGRSYAGNVVRNQQDRSRTFPGIAEAMAEQWGNGDMDGFGLDISKAKISPPT